VRILALRMTAPSDPIQKIFENTVRDFRANLKNDDLYNEILKTTTIDEVYDATDKLQEEQVAGYYRHINESAMAAGNPRIR
jgi:hypothetical protein